MAYDPDPLVELSGIREDLERLKIALEASLSHNDRLKKERDGARAENASLRSKLADETAPGETVVDAIAKALGGGNANLLARPTSLRKSRRGESGAEHYERLRKRRPDGTLEDEPVKPGINFAH